MEHSKGVLIILLIKKEVRLVNSWRKVNYLGTESPPTQSFKNILLKIHENRKNAYDVTLHKKYRYTDHKYVKMCLQMKKTWNAQKDLVGIWMISLPYLPKFV